MPVLKIIKNIDWHEAVSKPTQKKKVDTLIGVIQLFASDCLNEDSVLQWASSSKAYANFISISILYAVKLYIFSSI